MTEELKQAAQQALEACPFCGSKNIKVHSYSDAAIGGEPDAFAQCHDCSVTGPNGKTEAEAAQAWNTRALTQRPAAQTEREAPRWTVSIEPVEVSGEPDAYCLRASIGNQSFHIGPDYLETKQEAEFFAEMFLHAIEVGHRASLPAPQQATAEPVQVFLVRDVAALLGASVPDVCRVLSHLGHGQRSTNMEITPDEALAVADHIRAAAATTERKGEPVAWMWQHEETGRTGFVEADQLAMGWEANNPRLKIVAPLYTSSQVPDYAWKTIAAYEKDAGFQVDFAFKAGWRMARTMNSMFQSNG